MNFAELVEQIPQLGYDWHRDTLLENTKANFPNGEPSIRFIKARPEKCLIVSAGPSLYRQNSLERARSFKGTVVATDGAFIQCLKKGLYPDIVITIDPHPTRIVRWFGDPDIKKNLNGDDYFERQDLDVSFRKNAETMNKINIKLVNLFNPLLIIACSAPANVVRRTRRLDRRWFVPLVDDPEQDGLTKAMQDITGLPAMNTGGTVGNCAWVFAHSILKSKDIACVGMDFAYYPDTPYEQTQSWHMLKGRENYQDYYPQEASVWGKFYTDPTYYWYRQNLLDLLEAGNGEITNCTEGGLLYGNRVKTATLEQWLNF